MWYAYKRRDEKNAKGEWIDMFELLDEYFEMGMNLSIWTEKEKEDE